MKHAAVIFFLIAGSVLLTAAAISIYLSPPSSSRDSRSVPLLVIGAAGLALE